MPQQFEELDPRLVDALGHPEPDTYPGGGVPHVEHVQTHLSHVFLTPERVYKLHKSVGFDFVDFRSRKARNEDALREVAYNRRLAPDVYLGVAPVLERDGRPVLGEPAETLAPPGPGGAPPEHCVVMRRLPEGRDAQSLLARGELGLEQIRDAAFTIARFHAAFGLGAPAPFSAEEWWRRTNAPVAECFAALGDGALAREAQRLGEGARARFAACRPRFERRRREGRAVEAHGDLHLQHLWFEPGRPGPLVIDCIAFGDELRRIDAASDVAFLAMDLRYRNAPDLAERFLSRYATEADDHDLYAVVDLFVAYRAAVRAKVASLAAQDGELERKQRERAERSAREHLELVRAALEPAAPGALAVLCGPVGTGKSSVAAALAEAAGGVVIASDRVRKARAGLAPTERGGAELYSEAATRAVYASLLERARTVVESGRVAVLDATFASRALRAPALELARELAPRALLVEAACDRDVVLARLAERERRGGDPSDAGPELYPDSARSFEPPDEWPAGQRARVHTDRDGWRARAAALAERLAAPRAETS